MNAKTLKTILLSCMLIIMLSACSEPGMSSIAQPIVWPAQVDHVEVQFGAGSPIPVTALISGNLPDTCSEFSDIQLNIKDFEFQFQIEVEQSSGIVCTQDLVPFSLTIPLNMVNRPPGVYLVNANSVSASFIWPVPESDTSIQTEDATAAIYGWVWHDLCASGLDGQPQPSSPPPGCIAQESVLGAYHADGVKDAEEPIIGGVVVSLGEGACPSTGLAEFTTVPSDISYSFLGLVAGTYCVSIDPHSEPNIDILLPGEWTYPNLEAGVVGATIKLNPGDTRWDVNFGWDHQFLPDAP